VRWHDTVGMIQLHTLEYNIMYPAPPTANAVTSDHSSRAKSSTIWIAIVTDKIKTIMGKYKIKTQTVKFQ